MMRGFSQDQLNAAYRIVNKVESLVKYYGKRFTFDEAIKLISRNQWIMFPVKGIDSLREGVGLPVPNVYISFDTKEISDNGNGVPRGWIGINYNNGDSMIGLKDILRRPRKCTEFFKIITCMPDWTVSVLQKVKCGYPDSTPEYESFRTIDADCCNKTWLSDTIVKCDNQKYVRGDDFNGDTVLGAVTIVSIDKKTGPDSFHGDVVEAFEAFEQVML